MRRLHTRSLAAALLAVAVSLAGCTTLHTGSPVRASDGPPPGAVDTTLLDPGNYPTKPRAPLGAAGTPAKGALLDAQRMADYVIGPWEADPALIAPLQFGGSPGAMPLKSGNSILTAVMTPEPAAAAESRGYVDGYASGRQVENQIKVINAVIRMADPAAAAAAATDMANAFVPALPETPTNPIPVPGHPETSARAHSWTDIWEQRTWNIVNSFTAHGTYVLYQRVEVTGTFDSAAALVGRLLDAQAPRIDEFRPTPADQFPTLPRDPDGLLAVALPKPADQQNVNQDATFGSYGALHLTRDPIKAAERQATFGVDRMASSEGYVVRTRDASAAAEFTTSDAEDTATTAVSKADPVPNLPGSQCFRMSDEDGFWCIAASGRYSFNLYSNQLKDVHQQMAAQYILLESV